MNLKHDQGKGPGKRNSGKKRLQGAPDSEEILKLVTETFHVFDEIKNKGSRSAGRKTAIYLMHRYSVLSISEIGELFVGIHFSAVGKILSRLKEEIATNKKLFRKARQIESKIKA